MPIEPIDPQPPVLVRAGRSILRSKRLIAAIVITACVIIAAFMYTEAHRFAASDSSANPTVPGEVNHWRLEVVNGTGKDGLAQGVTDLLRRHGYDVVDYRTQRTPLAPRCQVIDRSGDRAAADEVAKTLGLPPDRVSVQVDRTLFLDVTVIVGADFRSFNMLSRATR